MDTSNHIASLERPDRVFVLSGPSGVGKNTVAAALCKSGRAVRAVTATSREPRPGERDGADYYFVGREEFEGWLRDGRLLEHNCYDGNYYGTPAFSVNRAAQSGKPVLLVIDVNGALAVKKLWPQVKLVFLSPPSDEALEQRLRARGDEDARSVAYRLKRAREEMTLRDRYDYVVVNDRLEDAVDEVAGIIDH